MTKGELILLDQPSVQVLHPLVENSAEWRRVEDFFNSNLQTRCQVVKVERCQNKDLWRKYAWQKKLMTERNGADNVNERLVSWCDYFCTLVSPGIFFVVGTRLIILHLSEFCIFTFLLF